MSSYRLLCYWQLFWGTSLARYAAFKWQIWNPSWRLAFREAQRVTPCPITRDTRLQRRHNMNHRLQIRKGEPPTTIKDTTARSNYSHTLRIAIRHNLRCNVSSFNRMGTSLETYWLRFREHTISHLNHSASKTRKQTDYHCSQITEALVRECFPTNSGCVPL